MRRDLAIQQLLAALAVLTLAVRPDRNVERASAQMRGGAEEVDRFLRIDPGDLVSESRPAGPRSAVIA